MFSMIFDGPTMKLIRIYALVECTNSNLIETFCGCSNQCFKTLNLKKSNLKFPSFAFYWVEEASRSLVL